LVGRPRFYGAVGIGKPEISQMNPLGDEPTIFRRAAMIVIFSVRKTTVNNNRRSTQYAVRSLNQGDGEP